MPRPRPFVVTTLVVFFISLLATFAWQSYVHSAAPTPAVVEVIPTQVEAAPILTALPSASFTPIPPTYTPPPVQTMAATPPLSPAVTEASAVPSPTFTPIASATPLATPTPFAAPDVSVTPATAVPTPAPTFAVPDGVTNVLLLGNDSDWVRGGRTDTMIIVSINQETKTAAMLSLPRDLFVFIPGWTMAKLNTAVPHGYNVNHPGGGVELLKETILYNFGIPIDYYARVGFDSFKRIVDSLGGVEVVVSCPLTDWRLKAADLDPNVVENWEQFTLEPGVHDMDGDLALWYVRSRMSSNDFERSRRQQQVLRAILNQGAELELLREIPSLWATYQENVQTDMELATMLRLAALAPAVRDNGIQHLHLTYGALKPWREPGTGQAVQLLQWEEAREVLQQLFLPPVLNRTARPPIYVEVVSRYRLDYRLAADNLAWYGFIPVHTPADSQPAHTSITYYGDNFKGSFDWLLSWVFRQDAADVHLVAGESYPYDYRVTVGADYVACRPYLSDPPAP